MHQALAAELKGQDTTDIEKRLEEMGSADDRKKKRKARRQGRARARARRRFFRASDLPPDYVPREELNREFFERMNGPIAADEPTGEVPWYNRD